MKWSTPLFEPIALPGGRNLVTLGDAGNYVAALPALEQRKDHWQAAAHALMLSSRAGDPYLGWIGVKSALAHGRPAPADPPRRKRARAYKVIR